MLRFDSAFPRESTEIPPRNTAQVTPDVAVELVVRVRDYDIPGTNATYRTRSYCDPAGCSNGLPVFGSMRWGNSSSTSVISFPRSPQPM